MAIGKESQMAKAIKLLTTTESLAAECKNLPAALKRSDTRVGIYLMSETMHIEEHRNPTRLNTFFAAVKGTGSRTMAMHNFIQHFANVQFVPLADIDKSKQADRYQQVKEMGFGGIYVMKAKRNVAPETILAEMQEKSWVDFKPEGKAVDFNLDSRVTSLLVAAFKAGITPAQIEKAIANHTAEAKQKVKEANERKAKEEKAKQEAANDTGETTGEVAKRA